MSTCFHTHTNFESSSTFSSFIERVLSPTHGRSSPTRHTTKDLTHLAHHTPHRDPNDRPSAHVDRARSQTSNFTLDSKLSPRSSQACGPIIAAMGSVTLDVYPRDGPTFARATARVIASTPSSSPLLQIPSLFYTTHLQHPPTTLTHHGP